MTGATKVGQIEANGLAGDWRLTPDELRQVDELCAA
jgi:aryl-alcohol dehydrogenase-like predicted oxidoreductase